MLDGPARACAHTKTDAPAARASPAQRQLGCQSSTWRSAISSARRGSAVRQQNPPPQAITCRPGRTSGAPASSSLPCTAITGAMRLVRPARIARPRRPHASGRPASASKTASAPGSDRQCRRSNRVSCSWIASVQRVSSNHTLRRRCFTPETGACLRPNAVHYSQGEHHAQRDVCPLSDFELRTCRCGAGLTTPAPDGLPRRDRRGRSVVASAARDRPAAGCFLRTLRSRSARLERVRGLRRADAHTPSRASISGPR